MAIYPKAQLKEIPAGSNDPHLDVVVGIIYHVDAGGTADLYDYFKNRSGGIESHFHIREDGHVYQYRNTSREADANYRANSWVGPDGRRYGYLSVETQGKEYGEWTSAQIKALKELTEWAAKTHDFPVRAVRKGSPKMSGVGYHTLHGAPSDWTPVAKSCPGPNRIKQFDSIFRTWFRDRVDNVQPSTPEPVHCPEPVDVVKDGAVVKKPKPKPKSKPVVSLKMIVKAAKTDPNRAQGGRTRGAGDDVRIVEQALRRGGFLERQWIDGAFGTKTVQAYAAWQRSLGYTGRDADGIPGWTSLVKLGRKYGFNVVR